MLLSQSLRIGNYQAFFKAFLITTGAVKQQIVYN